ncbi:MAG: VCBS repeat-containing protein, partial [Armatimonadetes bacterium]|nr:VCBS repeat-containing protein [Armatimonadota bacterium]
GKRLWQFSTKAGPECTAAAASDLDGDGRAEVAFGVADGTIQVVGPDGQLKWMVDTSDAVSFLACADINGDGRPELLAASANALAYAFDAAGRTIWHRPLPKPIKTAALAGRTLVCGCSDGSVWLVLPRDGSIVGRFETTGEPICAASLGETAVLATSLGALTAVGSAE